MQNGIVDIPTVLQPYMDNQKIIQKHKFPMYTYFSSIRKQRTSE